MASFIRNFQRGWRINRMRRELAHLSDGQLKDIGIHRGQIDDLSRYCYGVGHRPDAA